MNSFSWPRSDEEQDDLIKLITQIGLILTSKADHLFTAFGIQAVSMEKTQEGLIQRGIDEGHSQQNA